MPSSAPFVNPATVELDTDQIIAEAFPLGKLIGAFVAVSLVPFGLGFFAAPSTLGALLIAVGQFVLAVGTGIVLMYVIARGGELAES